MENKIEYIIYTRINQGTPYIIATYYNIYQAKLRLYEIIEEDKDRAFKYYVDNDFFENEYHLSQAERYYCLKYREISRYKKYYEFEDKNQNLNINDKRYAELKKKCEKMKKREKNNKIIKLF